jgi:hypothetical protein
MIEICIVVVVASEQYEGTYRGNIAAFHDYDDAEKFEIEFDLTLIKAPLILDDYIKFRDDRSTNEVWDAMSSDEFSKAYKILKQDFLDRWPDLNPSAVIYIAENYEPNMRYHTDIETLALF